MQTGKSKRATILAATAAALSSQLALAATWNGGAGAWSNASAWSTGRVPGGGVETDAIINGGLPSIDAAYALANLNLNGGFLSGTSGGLTVANEFRFNGGAVSTGANLTINGSAQLVGAALGNAGTIAFNASPTSSGGLSLNNGGTVSLGAGVTLRLPNGSTTAGRYTGAAGSTLLLTYDGQSADEPQHILTGTARIATAGAFHADDTAVVIQPGATIQAGSITFDNFSRVYGFGEFISATRLASTSINPGAADGQIGTMQFDAGLSLDTAPVLLADLKSAGGPTADLLNATGPVTFDDNGIFLNANITADSGPLQAGERFVVIHSAAGLAGDAAKMINPGSYDDNGYVPGYDADGNLYEFSVDITRNDVALVYVPEPAVLGLIVATLLVRRRRLP